MSSTLTTPLGTEYRDLGDGYVLRVEPDGTHEIPVGWTIRDGALRRAPVTLTLERASGKTHRLRLPLGLRYLALVIARDRRVTIRLPLGHGHVTTVSLATNVTRTTHGAMVIF